jgi:hypothetical protein
MNLRVLIAAIVALGVSGIAVMKLTGTGLSEAVQKTNLMPQAVIEPPQINESGPQPKVGISEVDFEFGRMEVNETRSHDFVFTNQGDAPLTIKMGETTCQCTYGDLKKGEERTIEPGKSQNVKLTWKPEFANDMFSKGADILTNDPKKRTISIRVVGRVATRLTIHPGTDWNCPDLVDDQPVLCAGGLVSGLLEKFNVTAVERRGEPMEYEVEAMNSETLFRSNQAASGYHVRIKVKPEMQMGNFAFPVTIKTDVPVGGEGANADKMTEFEIVVMGVRRGPIHFAGPHWVEEKMAISVPAFVAAEGISLEVPFFVKNPPEGGLKLTKPPEVTPSELKVEIVPEPYAGGKSQRLKMKLTYPAGAQRVDYRNAHAGTIQLTTNHPNAPTVEVLVYLYSR